MRSLRLSFVLALALPFSAALAQQAQPKFGIVDMQEVLLKANDFTAARNKLQQSTRAKGEQMQKEELALRQEAQLLQVQMQTMTPEQQKQKATEFKAKEDKLVKKLQQMQQDVAEAQERELKRAMDKVQPIVAKISERENFAAVLSAQAVVYFPSTSKDITGEVISTYNATKSAKADAPVRSDAPTKK